MSIAKALFFSTGSITSVKHFNMLNMRNVHAVLASMLNGISRYFYTLASEYREMHVNWNILRSQELTKCV